ncbi:FKBP-type peptidyl-prolyl cis-trans isomerase [Fibrella aquatica]|jgi:FKBP-type peptidyl-prolyl cis-trans isomerase|uniref:FKBP-type peptidyl-prolyl cis-trans isomerase n=1 Tax=Fibrella aquatica TaxID=3242487 RepID=UPI0035209D65
MRSVFQRYFLLATALLSGFWLVSCQQTGEALSDRKQRENAVEIQEYITANNLQATQLGNTGTFYIKTVSAPTSQSAQVGDEIRFFVTSRRLDGTVLDSTDGIHPATYTYGTTPNRTGTLAYGSYLYNTLTNGVFLGLTVAREGEQLSVLVPSSLDAGRQGTLLLPQYSPIRYDIRVISIRTEREQIDEYIAANKITVTDTLGGGIRIAKTLARPDSALLKVGETASIQYTGKLLNGTVFDTNVPTASAIATDPTSATAAYDVTIGQTSVISGWTLALQKVRRGERFLLLIPSAQAYGASSSGAVITPYSPLLFEMNILRVK